MLLNIGHVYCTNCRAQTGAADRFCNNCGTALTSAPPRAPKFWTRVCNGFSLLELARQFRSEARSSYRLYSQELSRNQSLPAQGSGRWMPVAKALFWAMMLKLSPSRRLLLLIAFIFLFPVFHIESTHSSFSIFFYDSAFWSAAILIVLLALELADRVSMKRDLEIGRDIQQWLMPSTPPPSPGAEIAFTTRPANTVAGDYYDVFYRNPDNTLLDAPQSLILAVADVAGKSVPAALLAATLQASLRTLASEPHTLVELTTLLNRYACSRNVTGQRFTTAFIAEWMPGSDTLTYVNAGHNWPVLLRANGSMERLQTGGIPLGIQAAAPYTSAAVNISQGDVLFVFTDGVVEAENEREEEFGEGRLLNSLAVASRRPAADSLRYVLSAVDGFVAGTPQHDDITCLVFRRTADTASSTAPPFTPQFATAASKRQ